VPKKQPKWPFLLLSAMAPPVVGFGTVGAITDNNKKRPQPTKKQQTKGSAFCFLVGYGGFILLLSA
jgi:hypothetical protein